MGSWHAFRITAGSYACTLHVSYVQVVDFADGDTNHRPTRGVNVVDDHERPVTPLSYVTVMHRSGAFC